ncbi:sugar metabolism transcriptional regulator [Fictibacillus macauensis ZFHKF-1]|uniref:Sugar metabolism transcriptional regulator n=1 Tax=Fictibacillus macauensis ZFHKF-1 TaxID=1196324 RepID=I8UJ02_9BACL|nr:DeoR/GlpR family DNA-binding transcription regulator [Fictibacillus macauensis]EIT86808.1 sugar metabolism transcriptional regulator [Fictibacillus macauensis ZFHKF-1]
MLRSLRLEKIMGLVDSKQMATLDELMQATHSSESTIRRDLDALEKEGKLSRVHGGAIKRSLKNREASYAEKAVKFSEEKERIGQYAATFVANYACIFLDAGTTVAKMIPYLTAVGVTVVTNGIDLVSPLLKQGIQTYVVGGKVKERTGAFVGSNALHSLEQYRFDACFLGMNGIHPEWGYTTPDPEEAMLKQKVLSLSKVGYVLADASKLGESCFSSVASLRAATLVTSNGTTPLTLYENKTNIKVVKL